MSFFSWAFNDQKDPYWACYYGVTTHPLYHQCDNCPSLLRCLNVTSLYREPQFVPDGWTASKSDFEDRIIEWGLNHGGYKPEDVYWSRYLNHYVRRKWTLKRWLKEHFGL